MVLAFVVVVTTTKTMKTGLSWTKMTTISTRYNFVPHLAINHHEADKCLFLQTHFLCCILMEIYLKKELLKLTDIQVKKEPVQHEPVVSKPSIFVLPGTQ